GQHRLAAGSIAMIRGVVGFLAAGRVPQMVRQLAAQRSLDNRLLEATDGGVELLSRKRTVAHKLVENLVRNGREWCVRRETFPFAAHSLSSCYAPHTKFRIPSRVTLRATPAVPNPAPLLFAFELLRLRARRVRG